MNWSDFLPPADLLTKAEGVERGLRQYQKLGRLGWVAGIGILTLQITILLSHSGLWQTVPSDAWTWPTWMPLSQVLPDPIKTLLFLGIGLLLASIWVRRRLQEAQYPFRYTCSVGAFTQGAATVPEEKLAWLEQDLAQRLSKRVGRFLFVDEKVAERKTPSDDPHIHIWGTYVIREDRQGRSAVEIMPRVRIGQRDGADTLAYPVTYYLDEEMTAPRTHDHPAGTSASVSPSPCQCLTPEDYERILERVYFSVATELYRQIQQDVQRKINLLPTAYARAVALFHEANDYARSNTLGGYEDAERLYQGSAELLDCRLGLRPRSRWRRPLFVLRCGGVSLRFRLRRGLARLWPSCGRAELLCARAQIGYATMLLSRRPLAEISGQRSTAVFEARPVSEQALARLQRLPEAVPERNQTLFDAYVTCAYVLAELGATSRAQKMLRTAQGLDPSRAEQHAPYLATMASCGSHLMSRLELLKRAVDLDPENAIIHFQLAYDTERLWRSRRQLEPTVANLVLRAYDALIKLNPGLIAGWANRGYVNWLLHPPKDSTAAGTQPDYLQRAFNDFENGREYKTIKRVTAVSEFNYGLARIAAERNQFPAAYEYYVEGISEMLAQAVSHNARDYTDYYFKSMSDDMMERFERYKATVKDHWQALKRLHSEEVPPRVADSVYAFVLNDYGGACYNYFLSTGNRTFEAKAMQAFEQAIQHNDDFVLPYYNLFNIRAADQHLEKVAALAPNWLTGKFARLRRYPELAKDLENEVCRVKGQIVEVKRDLEAINRVRDQLKRRDLADGGSWKTNSAEAAIASMRKGSKRAEGKDKTSTRNWGTPFTGVEDEFSRQQEKKTTLQHRIATLTDQALRYRNHAQVLYESLLPHEWLWKSKSLDAKNFDWSVFERHDLRGERRWVREFTEFQAWSLFEGRNLLTRIVDDGPPPRDLRSLMIKTIWRHFRGYLRQAVDDRHDETVSIGILLDHLQEHFWPRDFNLLRALRQVARSRRERQYYNRGLSDIIKGWLEEEPDTYWALGWVRDPDTPRVGQERYFADADMVEIYNRTVERSNNPHVVLYVAEELKRLAKELASPLGSTAPISTGEAKTASDRPTETAMRAESVWKHCLDALKRARGLETRGVSVGGGRAPFLEDPARSEAWYHGHIAHALWALGRHQEALEEMGHLQAQPQGATEIGLPRCVDEICRDFGSPQTFLHLQQWLTAREQRMLQMADETGWLSTRQAAFALHRARYLATEPSASMDASVGTYTRSVALKMKPLVIELHSQVLIGKAATPRQDPLFADDIPRMLDAIQRRFGIRISEPLAQVNDSYLSEHTYGFMINEIRLGFERILPHARCCPRWRAVEPLMPKALPLRGEAFNPLSGRRDAVWLDESDIGALRRIGVELWDRYDYITHHLKFVLCQHLDELVGFQEVSHLLASFDDATRPKAMEVRQQLLGYTPADFQARADFMRTLQLLLRERVPVTDLGTVLTIFGTQWTAGGDVTPIVEAVRFNLREALPCNHLGALTHWLSGAFEQTMAGWVHGQGNRRVFALPPEDRNKLINSLRRHLGRSEEYRTVLVVQNYELRPYVARLIKPDFPLLTVLAERELRDEVRQQAGVSVVG